MSQAENTSLIGAATTPDTPESPAEVSEKHYGTGFCTSPESCKRRVNEIVGFIFMLLILYYCVTYFSALLPYAHGIFKVLKYLILYTLVFSTILLFIHLLSYLFWWITLFYWAIERVADPLKDQITREWYYYFTDNVNWIIYGGSTIYFTLWVIGLAILLCLIILPAVSVIGFLVGYLFSLMGEAPCDKPSGTILGRIVSGTMKGVSGISSGVSSGVSSVSSGVSSGVSSVIKKIPSFKKPIPVPVVNPILAVNPAPILNPILAVSPVPK